MSPSKQKILDEALRLFSTNGYEATSIGQITNAVGIKKASLYSHFKSKQEILDTLIEEMSKRYDEQSLFSKINWENNKQDYTEYITFSVDDFFQIIKKQLNLLIHDPYLSMTTKFLTIEQFRNPQFSSMLSKRIYTDVLNFHKGLIQYLIENGVLINDDVEILALEFFAPISIQLYRIQREPEREEDAMRIIENHIKHICKMYCKK